MVGDRGAWGLTQGLEQRRRGRRRAAVRPRAVDPLRVLARIAVALYLGSLVLAPVPAGGQSSAVAVPQPELARHRLQLAEIAGRRELFINPTLEVVQGQTRLGRGSLMLTMQRALENSYDLAAVAARAQAQQAQVDVARGALRPRLDLRLGTGHELVRPGTGTDPLTGKPPSQSDHPRHDSALVLRQSVLDAGLFYERDRQRSLAASGEAGVVNARHQVVLDATAAHLDVLQYSLMVEFAREYQVELDGLFQFVETRVSAGGASPVESERVNSRSISARSAAIEANGLLESALLTYRRIVGGVPESLPTDDVLASIDLPNLNDALARALRSNPNLLALREQERAVELEGKSAESRMLPKVDLEVGNYQGRGTGGPSVQTNESRAMVVMSWNALNGGADVAQARAAAARLEEARFRTKDLERRLEESLRIAYNTLDAVTQRTRSVRQELLSNQRVVEAFRLQLKSGNRQLLDVLDAEQRLYQSRTEVLRLTVMQANLTMQVLRQIGGLDQPLQETSPAPRAPVSRTPAPTPVRPAVPASPPAVTTPQLVAPRAAQPVTQGAPAASESSKKPIGVPGVPWPLPAPITTPAPSAAPMVPAPVLDWPQPRGQVQSLEEGADGAVDEPVIPDDTPGVLPQRGVLWGDEQGGDAPAAVNPAAVQGDPPAASGAARPPAEGVIPAMKSDTPSKPTAPPPAEAVRQAPPELERAPAPAPSAPVTAPAVVTEPEVAPTQDAAPVVKPTAAPLPQAEPELPVVVPVEPVTSPAVVTEPEVAPTKDAAPVVEPTPAPLPKAERELPVVVPVEPVTSPAVVTEPEVAPTQDAAPVVEPTPARLPKAERELPVVVPVEPVTSPAVVVEPEVAPTKDEASVVEPTAAPLQQAEPEPPVVVPVEPVTSPAVVTEPEAAPTKDAAPVVEPAAAPLPQAEPELPVVAPVEPVTPPAVVVEPEVAPTKGAAPVVEPTVAPLPQAEPEPPVAAPVEPVTLPAVVTEPEVAPTKNEALVVDPAAVPLPKVGAELPALAPVESVTSPAPVTAPEPPPTQDEASVVEPTAVPLPQAEPERPAVAPASLVIPPSVMPAPEVAPINDDASAAPLGLEPPSAPPVGPAAPAAVPEPAAAQPVAPAPAPAESSAPAHQPAPPPATESSESAEGWSAPIEIQLAPLAPMQGVQVMPLDQRSGAVPAEPSSGAQDE